MGAAMHSVGESSITSGESLGRECDARLGSIGRGPREPNLVKTKT